MGAARPRPVSRRRRSEGNGLHPTGGPVQSSWGGLSLGHHGAWEEGAAPPEVLGEPGVSGIVYKLDDGRALKVGKTGMAGLKKEFETMSAVYKAWAARGDRLLRVVEPLAFHEDVGPLMAGVHSGCPGIEMELVRGPASKIYLRGEGGDGAVGRRELLRSGLDVRRLERDLGEFFALMHTELVLDGMDIEVWMGRDGPVTSAWCQMRWLRPIRAWRTPLGTTSATSRPRGGQCRRRTLPAADRGQSSRFYTAAAIEGTASLGRREID